MTVERDIQIDDIIDRRYRVQRVVAKGGMGVIFVVRHLFIGELSALKATVAAARGRESSRKRLLQEATFLARCRHSNVVSVFEAGECESYGPYVVMELLRGRSLEGILGARRRLPPRDAVGVFIQIAAAVETAHAAGIVHRDIKPANIFIADVDHSGEIPKLLDFGIAADLAVGLGRYTDAQILRYMLTTARAGADRLESNIREKHNVT